ncbi:hypothetical protein [Paracoccus sp. ME4]|uniref:hypothetical protein n=1 Tax=Paracoccus sp. ME4 TaxID=3138066 RepID=UPI00398A57EA
MISIDEKDVRGADYVYAATVVTQHGESDLFVAAEGIPVIEVRLECDAAGNMAFTAAGFVNQGSPDLDIRSDDGSALGAEALEALANELIEHDVARGLEYAYGRDRSVDGDGHPVVMGGWVNRSVLDEEVIARLGENSELSPA